MARIETPFERMSSSETRRAANNIHFLHLPPITFGIKHLRIEAIVERMNPQRIAGISRHLPLLVAITAAAAIDVAASASAAAADIAAMPPPLPLLPPR